MKWNMIWSSLFGAASFLGIDMGFWVTMAAVFLIVIAMNAVFWGMKPRNPDSPKTRFLLASSLTGEQTAGILV